MPPVRPRGSLVRTGFPPPTALGKPATAKPLSVGIVLLDLVPASRHQPDLFAADNRRRQRPKSSAAEANAVTRMFMKSGLRADGPRAARPPPSGPSRGAAPRWRRMLAGLADQQPARSEIRRGEGRMLDLLAIEQAQHGTFPARSPGDIDIVGPGLFECQSDELAAALAAAHDRRSRRRGARLPPPDRQQPLLRGPASGG